MCSVVGLISSQVLAGPFEVEVESNRYIRLTFIQNMAGAEPNFKALESPQAYLVGPANGRGEPPARVGRESRLVAFENIEWPYRIETVEHHIYLELATPLKPKQAYRVRAGSGDASGGTVEQRFSWDDTSTINRNIKANQVGYLPRAGTKIAYLGGYLGTLGSLPLDHADAFHLVDADSRKRVLSGKPSLVRKNDRESGEDLYVLDFSKFNRPGRYYLHVPGVGRSYDFRIADDVYQSVFTTVARGLFHQRCGIALTKEHTQFTHAACHTRPALLTTAQGDSDDLASLPNKVVDGKTIDGWGGWHDAGDYDRRGVHITIPQQLMTIYEIAPDRFVDRQLNIPESGNGVPDILDEAAWGLDWFARMQDPEDGGVHYRVETAKFAHHKMPDVDDQPLYAYAKDTRTTIHLAGTAAQAARVFREIDPDRSAKYLRVAEAAWAYGREHADLSNRGIASATAYAAAELFKTTGQDEYHDVLKGESIPYEACWAYATSTQPGTDEQLRVASERRVIAQARKYAQATREPGYHRPVRQDPSWGNVANTPRVVIDMIQGYVLTQDKELYDAALVALGHQLGANPLGMTWITGVGHRYPITIAHNPSAADGIDEPVPGIPVYGYARMHGGSDKVRLYWSAQYPGVDNGYANDGQASNFPMLRRWCPEERIYIMNEFTVHENMGPAVFCYGFFIPPANASAR